MALTTASTVPEIIDTARRAGLGKVADRLDYLYGLPLDGDDPMDPDSARSLVSFLMRHHRELPKTRITMGPAGYVGAGWKFTADDDLAVQFMPSGDVRFYYATRDTGTGYLVERVMGKGKPDDMLKRVMPHVCNSM